MVGNRNENKMDFLRLSKKIDFLEKRIIELENNKKPAKKEVSKDDIVKKLK